MRSYEASEGTLCWNYGSTAQAVDYASGKITSTAKYAGSDVSCDSATTASIKKSFTYNTMGLPKDVTTLIDGNSYVQTQSYDIYSRPLVTTYPTGISGFAVKNVYNAFNYLFEIRNNASNALLKRIESMTDRGQVAQVSLGNGVTSLNGFRDDMGWLSSIDVAVAVSIILFTDLTVERFGMI